MSIWQADFHQRSLPASQEIIWEFIICDSMGRLISHSSCPQQQATSDWLTAQLRQAIVDQIPEKIQVFRPQSLSLIALAADNLQIQIEATPRTTALKSLLKQRLADTGISPDVEKPPPQALPENLWGESWRFGHLAAGELIDLFGDRPIPIRHLPEDLMPIKLGLSSETPIPGLVIYGGRQSMKLARWLASQNPIAINFIAQERARSGGLVLESNLCDRWILATFEDKEVAISAEHFQQQKTVTQDLHFLLIQPDDSDMTFTGFWLLQNS